MAGISRTPDIRIQAKLDRWAMRVPIQWVEPMLNNVKVTQLMLSAGILCGVGDWRLEKGGEAGAFRLAEPDDDAELRDIIESGGYLAQQEAMRHPVCSNAETEELMQWYCSELERRGINPETEQTEDIEIEGDETFTFGAGAETLTAPNDITSALAVQQNGEDFHG
jgi:hypothetical protein